MAGGVITISRRKYAAGLFWQPASGRGTAAVNAEKISRDAKLRASMFVLFGGMIGLTNRRCGARAQMPVAAAEVMESFAEQTFLSVFSVKEGYWLLAVRGGIIVRDAVYAAAVSAQTAYAELNRMPDWGLLVAPAEWNAPSAVERRLADFITGNKKYRLANISNLSGYIITAAILVVAAFFGYRFFEEPIKKMLAPTPDVPSEVAQEYRAGIEEIERPKPKPKKLVHVAMPYDALSDLYEKTGQCWQAVAFLSQPITGWTVDSVTCENGEASVHLLRSYGTIGDLYDEITAKMPNVAVFETGGSDVVLTAKLKPLETRSVPPAYSADEIAVAVQSVFQRVNEDVDFQKDVVDLFVPDLAEGEIPDTAKTEIPIVRIRADSKMQPAEFVKIIGDVGGADMTLIKWDGRSRTWNYEAVIYVK